MKANFTELKRRQLDDAIEQTRAANLPPRPPSGWIRSIREALGMPASYLASRLGVSVPTATRLEMSEAGDRISLSTLRRAAAALDCELQYVLVPRRSLGDTLRVRAAELARARMAAISHTMALEAQATSTETAVSQEKALAESLLNGSGRALWKSKGKG